jgi:hypothetical protein
MKGASSSGEFFLCPVYNELILDNRKIGVYAIAAEEMHGLGTPEDVEEFLKAGKVAGAGSSN